MVDKKNKKQEFMEKCKNKGFIAILDYTIPEVKIISVVDEDFLTNDFLTNDDIESYLTKIGYDTDSINWMYSDDNITISVA